LFNAEKLQCQRKVEMSGFAPDRNVRFFGFCRNGFRHG